MVHSPFTQKIAQEALKQAAKSAAAAGVAAVLRRFAEAVPGTPGLVLRGTIAVVSITVGFLNRR